MPEPWSGYELPAERPELAIEPKPRTIDAEEQAASQAGNATLSEPRPARGTVKAEPLRVAGYEILEELGRGAMGVVYKARQSSLKRFVALKMILAGVHAGPEQLIRLRAEAEAVARLQHPHIVQIYEIGEHGGLPYLCLEFVDGPSLDALLAPTSWPVRRTTRLLEAAARAVHHAHERGVVHRDLKPANILLTADDTPKITDFGLAKRLDDSEGLTQSGVIMGTPSYMAPEQAAGHTKKIGPATDVYALGAILYRLLTGRPPFAGESPLETLDLIRTGAVLPPIQVNPVVPPELESICLHCLHKDAGARYPSAAELADDLQRFRTGVPPVARSGGKSASSDTFPPGLPARGRFSLRLLVAERPGVIAAISRVLAQHRISISSMVEEALRDVPEGGTVPMLIKTHWVVTDALRSAVASIDTLDCVRGPSVVCLLAE